jgi:hypothetical protein
MEVNIFAITQSLWKAFVASSFFHALNAFGIFAFFILLIADILLLSKRIQGDIKIAFLGAKTPSLKRSKYREKWDKIRQEGNSGDLSKAKIAVIEADQMFADVLGRIGYKGKDAGERLAAVKPGQLIGLNEVIQAHEIFKRVVRDSGYEIDASEIQVAIAGYEKVFRGLELFD